MAHGIYVIGRDFQVAEQMAWHNLTTLAKPVREHFPELKPMPLFFENNGQVAAKFGDNQYVIPVALDDMLPVAPPYCLGTYTLFQPRQAWDWVHEVLTGTGFEVSSVGMLWNRSFWFMGVKLQELNSLAIGDGRNCDFYLNFSGGLDKLVSPQAELSSILPVCHNTISLSRMTGEVLFKEKATKNFSARLETAKEEVEKAVGMTAVFKKAMDSLATRKCDENRAKKIFTGYLTEEKEREVTKTTQNRVESLVTLHKGGRGNKGETEFDLLNAFTEWQTRGIEGEKTKVPPGKRFASGEFGGNMDNKADFANLLTSRRGQLQEIERRGSKLLAAN